MGAIINIGRSNVACCNVSSCDTESLVHPSRSSVPTFWNTVNDFTLSSDPPTTGGIAHV
jgi:hypothetical protein